MNKPIAKHKILAWAVFIISICIQGCSEQGGLSESQKRRLESYYLFMGQAEPVPFNEGLKSLGRAKDNDDIELQLDDLRLRVDVISSVITGRIIAASDKLEAVSIMSDYTLMLDFENGRQAVPPQLQSYSNSHRRFNSLTDSEAAMIWMLYTNKMNPKCVR